MNLITSERLNSLYEATERKARKDFKLFKNDPLFIADPMLYWGEGDKSQKTGLVRISNTEFAIIKILIDFLKKFCNIPEKRIRV